LLAQFICDQDISGMLDEKNKDGSYVQVDNPGIHASLLELIPMFAL
jgi:hypothetical protein